MMGTEDPERVEFYDKINVGNWCT